MLARWTVRGGFLGSPPGYLLDLFGLLHRRLQILNDLFQFNVRVLGSLFQIVKYYVAILMSSVVFATSAGRAHTGDLLTLFPYWVKARKAGCVPRRGVDWW